MLVNIILLVIGFVFLVKGADLLIDGSVSFAKKYGISDIVIGLTIVAFGTSAPELFVNLASNFKSAGDLGVGNIIGASVANILLIAGVASFIYPIKIKKGTSYREVPLALAAVAILFLLANNLSFTAGMLDLSRLDGAVLLVFFAIFIYYAFGISRIRGEEHISYKKYAPLYSLMLIIIGIAGLGLGSDWVVRGGSALAQSWGISDAIIGLTIVSIGTTLPELTASAMAAKKKSADIAIGNIIGSTIFNLAFILGISALIKPIFMSRDLNMGFASLALAILVLLYFILKGKRAKMIERWEGVALICLYLIYLVFVVVG